MTKPVDLLTQIQREQWVARQRKKRQRSALADALSRCSGAREVLAAVRNEAAVECIGRNTMTNTALNKLLRRLPVQTRLTDEDAITTPRIINRPAHTLRERHRPAVLPVLVNPTPEP